MINPPQGFNRSQTEKCECNSPLVQCESCGVSTCSNRKCNNSNVTQSHHCGRCKKHGKVYNLNYVPNYILAQTLQNRLNVNQERSLLEVPKRSAHKGTFKSFLLWCFVLFIAMPISIIIWVYLGDYIGLGWSALSIFIIWVFSFSIMDNYVTL